MDEAIFSELYAANWGDITDPKRVPLKDREVADAIKEALWPQPVLQLSSSPDILGAITTGSETMGYEIYVWKVGRTVFLSGFIQGDGSVFDPNQNIIDILDSAYRPYDDTTVHLFSPAGIYASVEATSAGKIRLINNSITSTNKYTINAFWPSKLAI